MRKDPREATAFEHLVLYDGVCGLCNRLIQFVIRYDRRGRFAFASLQSETAGRIVRDHGGNPEELDTMFVLGDYRKAGESFLARGAAWLFLMREMGWPWRAASLLRVLPSAWIDFGYGLVARNRYRLFGKYDRCQLPSAELRARFLDI